MAGTKFFADTLKGNNGDLFLTIGEYNGWFSGLTVVRTRFHFKSGFITELLDFRVKQEPLRIQVAAAVRTTSTSACGLSPYRRQLRLIYLLT